MRRESIYLERPKPFGEVGETFTISGSVPDSWLKTSIGILDTAIFLDLLDVNGKTFMGTAMPVSPHWLSKFSHRVIFNVVFTFNEFNIGFLEQSQGRIVLKFNGNKHDEQEFFLPIVVSEFKPKNGYSAEIIEKHRNVERNILQYRKDLKNYRQELEMNEASRKTKDGEGGYGHLRRSESFDIAAGISKILNDADEQFDKYLYSEEDELEKRLEEKYKDAIEWRGPLLKGLVHSFKGFELRVYSDDHDKHFHVIHKGKRINARFSFPEIQLISYKNSVNTIGSKEEAKIKEFCHRPEIFAKFEKEFNKRQ